MPAPATVHASHFSSPTSWFGRKPVIPPDRIVGQKSTSGKEGSPSRRSILNPAFVRGALPSATLQLWRLSSPSAAVRRAPPTSTAILADGPGNSNCPPLICSTDDQVAHQTRCHLALPEPATGDSPVSREPSSDLAHDMVTPDFYRSRHRRWVRSATLSPSGSFIVLPPRRTRQPPLLVSANPVPFPCKVYGPALSGAALPLCLRSTTAPRR